MENGKYIIARTKTAGVFAGTLESMESNTVVLVSARRIWYWAGAASLSQLAMEGTNKPFECKFPCKVDRVKLFEVVEILDVSEEARKSIEEVPVWNQ